MSNAKIRKIGHVIGRSSKNNTRQLDNEIKKLVTSKFILLKDFFDIEIINLLIKLIIRS